MCNHVIMKKMRLPVYCHNSLMIIHALGHMMYIYIYIYIYIYTFWPNFAHKSTTGGLTNTTAVDSHLKVKDIECDVGLTKNYCIIVCMQKISSIHTLILKIQQIS